MCAIVEEYAEEKAKEEVLRASRQALLKGFRKGALAREAAAIMYPKIKPADIDALYQEANKKVGRSNRASSGN